MPRGLSVLFIALCMLGAVGRSWAEEDPTVTVKKLIAQLNDPDTVKREEAERQLVSIGAAALPLVKEAQTNPVPEVAARAKRVVSKLAQANLKPFDSYSDLMPATSIFYLEAPNAQATLEKLKASPIGKFWDSPAMVAFFKKHHAEQVPNDQKMLDSIREIPKFANGRALFALGDPSTAEAAELDPPLVYVIETKQAQGLEGPVRNLFQGMGDPIKATRPYGPFTIEEHISAQTVFGQDRAIHALTQKGIEAFLDSMVNRPAEPLTPLLKDIRALLPNYDFLLNMNATGFKALSEAGQMIDDDQVAMLEAIGFVEGSRWTVVAALNENGVEEYDKIVLGNGDKNEGLVAVLKKIGAAPEVADAKAPQAMDMIPWQAGLLFSLNGDVAKNAPALAKALRNIDALSAPLAPEPAKPAAKPGAVAPPNPTPAPGAPGAAGAATPTPKPGGLGAAALEAGGGLNTTVNPTGGPVAPVDQKPAAPQLTPRISKLEKTGIKLEALLSQVDGSIQLALFPQRVEEDAPETFPLSPLLVMVLKDATQIKQALEAAAAGPEPRFQKESLNGGVHYVDTQGDPETKPGFWIKDNYFAYSTERDLLDLSGVALIHARGNERMADRASFKRALGAKWVDPQAALTIFGDAEFVMDMPYKLAKVGWEEDADENPWPDYDKVVKPLLQGKPVVVQFKSTAEGMQIHAQTPLSLLGMIEAFRRPLVEANY